MRPDALEASIARRKAAFDALQRGEITEEEYFRKWDAETPLGLRASGLNRRPPKARSPWHDLEIEIWDFATFLVAHTKQGEAFMRMTLWWVDWNDELYPHRDDTGALIIELYKPNEGTHILAKARMAGLAVAEADYREL